MKRNHSFLFASFFALLFSFPAHSMPSGKAVVKHFQALSLQEETLSRKELRRQERSERRQDRWEKRLEKKLGKYFSKEKGRDRFSLGFIGVIVLVIGGLFVLLGLAIPVVGILFVVIGAIIGLVGLLLTSILGGISVES